jgi:hypothetical protein
MSKQVEEKSEVLSKDINQTSQMRGSIELGRLVLDKLNAPLLNVGLIQKKLDDIDKLVGSMVLINKVDIGLTTEKAYEKEKNEINNQYIRVNNYGSSQHLKKLEEAKEEIKRVHDHYYTMSNNVMDFKFLLNDITKELLVFQGKQEEFLLTGLETLKALSALDISSNKVDDALIDVTPSNTEDIGVTLSGNQDALDSDYFIQQDS